MCIYFYIVKFSVYLSVPYIHISFSSDTSPVELISSSLVETNPLEWPERHVLQNLETFEKAKQKMR